MAALVGGGVPQDVAIAARRRDWRERLAFHARPLFPQVGAERIHDAVLTADRDALPRSIDRLRQGASPPFRHRSDSPRRASTPVRAAALDWGRLWVSSRSFAHPPARDGGKRAALLSAERISSGLGRDQAHTKTLGPHRGFWQSVQQRKERGTTGTLASPPDTKKRVNANFW